MIGLDRVLLTFVLILSVKNYQCSQEQSISEQKDISATKCTDPLICDEKVTPEDSENETSCGCKKSREISKNDNIEKKDALPSEQMKLTPENIAFRYERKN